MGAAFTLPGTRRARSPGAIRHVAPRRIFAGIEGTGSVGVGAVLFAIGSEFTNRIYQRAVSVSPFLPLLIAPTGLAAVLTLNQKYFPGSQGSGIPQTIAALRMKEASLRNSVLSLRIAVGKILLTFLGLLSGASVGRDGPTVQIGAPSMHSLGRVVRFPAHEMEMTDNQSMVIPLMTASLIA